MIKSERRWLDWPAILLLLLALWLVGLRIQVTDWTDDLSLVQYGLILSALLGMSLGYSVFNRRALIWMTAAYSLITITWLFQFLMPADMVWAEKIIMLFRNVRLSLGEFFRNEPVEGADLFMVFMIITFWWIGFFAGFQLTRQGKPWLPLAILFGAFLIVDYYPPYVQSRQVFSALMVLFLLLLLGRMYYLHSHENWKTKRAMIDYGAGLDFGKNLIIFSLLLVMIAWGIPGVIQLLTPGTTEQQKFVDLWRPLQDRLANVVTDLRGPRAVSYDFFGRKLPLGTRISEDETTVFMVEVSNPRARGFRYYWRGYSYDNYADGSWNNTIEEYRSIRPSEWPLELPDWKARQKVDLVVDWQFNRSRLLYLPGSPLEVSRPVQWIIDDVGTGYDGIVLFGETSIYKDETYEAQAWVSVPTALQLENAGQDYPEWVLERYLQLPDDLSESFGELAREITDDLQNPLDKTLAITNYLRNTIEYAGEVNPPEGSDPLEWFLFESQQGFCNYYASAEVVLLRSIGIPARLVVGFVQGDRLEQNQFEVKLKHSHAWPEVFFPGIGWVEFEPTVIRTPPDLLYEDLSQIEIEPDNVQGLNDAALYLMQLERFENLLDEGVYDEITYLPRIYQPFREWGIFFATLAIIGLIFWIQSFRGSDIFDRRLPVLLENIFQKHGWDTPAWMEFLSYRATLSPIGKLFSEIPWMLRLLGKGASPGQTPAEQINVVIQTLPSASDHAQALLEEYEIFTFSPRHGDLETARLAHSRLWGQVLIASIKRLLQR